ncbi:putative F-box domain-containing protein [Helianthus annuus]|nr:putative F-box domain-containing protein [Helianthus annuus]KAJ0727365.1 putative F-box domain-containing protein [Helianthus annuus]KAJ0730162.1 putative F-box domain-containing protein [Helianthus annuus]KAJ0903467.1 putative F-box domain-containing protein [Helianthus annuus]
MPANMPFEIQEEIIKRVLPVKSLVRLRSVSKEWKSLIDSSKFITHHHSRMNQAQPHHLLVSYKDKVDSEVKYVSVVDDDNFPQQKLFCSAAVSPTVKLVNGVLILGCSHGLVCLAGATRDQVNRLIVVWNPSIRKSVGIVLPFGINVFGFGVCPKTSDPKIVMIPRSVGYDAIAEVFTLSSGSGSGSGAWRSIPMNLPHKLYVFPHTPIVIDGVMHWAAYDHFVQTDDVLHRRIISFDLTSEEFGEVDLPDGLARLARSRSLNISKLNQSLVVLDYHSSGDGAVCDVWMMLQNGVPKSSFTKLFTLKVRPNSIIGFRKNGLPIMCQPHRLDGELQVYEPGSEHMIGLGIYGWVFNMASYTESLLLLNHSDSIIK